MADIAKRPHQEEGYLVANVVRAFEAGHKTKLSVEDRRYVVGYLRMTRPHMRQTDIAKLLGVNLGTISGDFAELDTQLKNTISTLDVGLILAEYGLQIKRAIEDISRAKARMEARPEGATSKTYLEFTLAVPKLYGDWIGNLKQLGLVGDEAPVQDEFRYRAVSKSDGSITSEMIIKKVNVDLDEAQKKAKELTGQYDVDKEFTVPQLDEIIATQDS